MRASAPTKPLRECGDEDATSGRGPGQRAWYRWIATLVANTSVLDAGCGLGYGTEILGETASFVCGQDVDPRLAGPKIQIRSLESFRDSSFDTVVSVDVLEHIDDDRAFVANLVRISRQQVIMTTPNWTAGRCQWPFHIREYTPAQLRQLSEQFGPCRMWKGTPDGTEVYPIRYPAANDMFNRLRVAPAISQVARVVNHVLPSRARIHGHLAVAIDTRRSKRH
jgi:SAM-dependent methyltransferase